LAKSITTALYPALFEEPIAWTVSAFGLSNLQNFIPVENRYVNSDRAESFHAIVRVSARFTGLKFSPA
jgi:hypothetical protein